ncbi:MAG: amidohydrolase, partial [Planctomycetota bacterium]|nr:amidohydrolase [Planctomycetota bacterium]
MDTERIRSLIREAQADLVRIRRDLHAHPELGYQEQRTSGVVQAELKRLGIEHVAGVAGGTGVVAHLPATDAAAVRPAVGLRADMDALPIVEATGVAHASTNEGVMHACGHDGHTTMLLGAARVLSAMAHRPNPVTFLFQPAEEGGAGGERMCQDGAMEGRIIGPKVGRVFGLHGWPDISVGHVASRPGPLLAAVDTFDVTLRGVGGHAAYPHYTVDPVIAACHCVTALQTIASRNTDPLDPIVVSVTGGQAGSADNVIPNSARFFGTVRTHDEGVRKHARERFHAIVPQFAAA